jgi:hypothetical protein
MVQELESWGMPHGFVLRSFKTFPYNHPSASYAILEHRKAVLNELAAHKSTSTESYDLEQGSDLQ